MQILSTLQPYLWPILAAVGLWLIKKGLNALHVNSEVMNTILAFTQRGYDLFQKDISAALDPSSDGGAKITAAELSKLRNDIWLFCQSEAKGPVGQQILVLGENWVKGQISRFLEAKGVVVGATKLPESK